MAKFSKKLSKIKKHLANCIVLGEGFGHLEDILESFGTVFILGATSLTIRQRNIIYVADVDYVSSLSDIDMVFVDLNRTQDMRFLAPAITRWKPIIFIEGPEIISNEQSESIKSLNYEVVELEKHYQVWKPKKSRIR